MEMPIHRTPSVGSIIKKITTLNPELGMHDIIQIIKLSTETQGDASGEFKGVEVINEAKAIALTQATLHS